MNNIKIFESDLPSDLDLSKEKVIGLDFNISSIRPRVKTILFNKTK